MSNQNQDANLNNKSNSELIELARTGLDSAFNELMIRHRKQAFHWAHQYTNDPFLAEDIVQEALISAFLYLGSLEHIEKFIPWFRRIITNQALMHLRRGGPYGKERPFSSLSQHWESFDLDSDYGSDSIEAILSRLARQRLIVNSKETDPAQLWLRQETTNMLQQLLECLTPKEREVFQAHFFKLYTPQEIATMTSTSSSNVYTILSRSRRKVLQHQYDINLTHYLQSRSANTNHNLQLTNLYFGEIWDTFALSVLHASQFYREPISMVDIMGFTGQAFRLHIHQHHFDLFESNAFHMRSTFTKGLLNLGFVARTIGDGQHIPQSSDLLIEAFSFIHKSIDQGQPVIVWGVNLPYFALAHGYDDIRREFQITGLFEQQKMSYSELGLNWSADLFVLSLGNPCPVPPLESLRGALSMIIIHAEGREHRIHPDYVQGIAAYDVWINSLAHAADVDPLAHAYQVGCTCNARHFAYQFLESTAKRIEDYGETICTLASSAATYYNNVAQCLNRLRTLFPFPTGGDHSCPATRDHGIQLLEQIKESEQKGLELLKKMLILM